MKISKTIIMAVTTLMIAGVTTTACKNQRGDNTSEATTLAERQHQRGDNTSEASEQAERQHQRSDNTIEASCTGTIDHSTWKPDASTSVEFSAFPKNIDQWKQMQETLGTEPQGAAALQVMAFELYRNNRTDGEEALRLNNTTTNYNSTVERLREIMGNDKFYARPYIAWALLNGATPENGYSVEPPYIINMKVDPNKKYQQSQFLKGTVIYLLIDSKGWDTNWRGVEVVKPEGSKYFVVSNCPALYTQCKEAKTTK